MSAAANNVEMSDLLQLTVDEGSSDLHIRVGLPPVLRIHGSLSPLDLPPLTPEDTDRLMKSITSPEHQQNVRENGGTDFGFRYNMFLGFQPKRLQQFCRAFSVWSIVARWGVGGYADEFLQKLHLFIKMFVYPVIELLVLIRHVATLR